MPFGLSCPSCQANFLLPDELAGRQVKCQRCGEVFRAPAAATPAPDEVVSARVAEEPAPPPMPRPRRDDFDADIERPRRRSGWDERRPPPRGTRAAERRMDPWVIVGVVGGAVLFLGGIVAAVAMISAPRPQPIVWKGAPAFGGPGMAPPGVFPGNQPPPPPLDVAKAIQIQLVKGAFQGNFAFNANDMLDPDRRNPCKLFVVTFEAGKTYVIDHKRAQQIFFDPYLRLENPNGIQVAFNDDHGGTLDSQIRFTPALAGSYRIIATTLSGGVGEFTLSIRDGSLPEPAGALPMKKQAGIPFVPKLESKDAVAPGAIKGKLALNDRVQIGSFRRAGAQHVIQLEANASYRIECDSPAFKSIVHVVDDTGRILHTQARTAAQAVIMFRPPVAGAYRFVVGSLPQGAGDYTLTVQKQEGNPAPRPQK